MIQQQSTRTSLLILAFLYAGFAGYLVDRIWPRSPTNYQSIQASLTELDDLTPRLQDALNFTRCGKSEWRSEDETRGNERNLDIRFLFVGRLRQHLRDQAEVWQKGLRRHLDSLVKTLRSHAKEKPGDDKERAHLLLNLT